MRKLFSVGMILLIILAGCSKEEANTTPDTEQENKQEKQEEKKEIDKNSEEDSPLVSKEVKKERNTFIDTFNDHVKDYNKDAIKSLDKIDKEKLQDPEEKGGGYWQKLINNDDVEIDIKYTEDSRVSGYYISIDYDQENKDSEIGFAYSEVIAETIGLDDEKFEKERRTTKYTPEKENTYIENKYEIIINDRREKDSNKKNKGQVFINFHKDIVNNNKDKDQFTFAY